MQSATLAERRFVGTLFLHSQKPDGIPIDCIPTPVFQTPVIPTLFDEKQETVVKIEEPKKQREEMGETTPPLLPPMGFNTWNRWHCWVDEHKLKETADQLVALGLAKAGYTNLNIDDCWQAHRALDSNGRYNGTILAEPSRFPSGIKGIADHAHSKQLQFGAIFDSDQTVDLLVYWTCFQAPQRD
jgi:alpha-galactosidase